MPSLADVDNAIDAIKENILRNLGGVEIPKSTAYTSLGQAPWIREVAIESFTTTLQSTSEYRKPHDHNANDPLGRRKQAQPQVATKVLKTQTFRVSFSEMLRLVYYVTPECPAAMTPEALHSVCTNTLPPSILQRVQMNLAAVSNAPTSSGAGAASASATPGAEAVNSNLETMLPFHIPTTIPRNEADASNPTTNPALSTPIVPQPKSPLRCTVPDVLEVGTEVLALRSSRVPAPSLRGVCQVSGFSFVVGDFIIHVGSLSRDSERKHIVVIEADFASCMDSRASSVIFDELFRQLVPPAIAAKAIFPESIQRLPYGSTGRVGPEADGGNKAASQTSSETNPLMGLSPPAFNCAIVRVAPDESPLFSSITYALPRGYSFRHLALQYATLIDLLVLQQRKDPATQLAQPLENLSGAAETTSHLAHLTSEARTAILSMLPLSVTDVQIPPVVADAVRPPQFTAAPGGGEPNLPLRADWPVLPIVSAHLGPKYALQAAESTPNTE